MITDQQINSLVTDFFRNFLNSLIKDITNGKPITPEPRQVKMAVAQHIEELAPKFNESMFYSLVRINYSAAEAETALRTFVAQYTKDNGTQPTFMELLPFACRTTECYDILIAAYREKIYSLLESPFNLLNPMSDFPTTEEEGSPGIKK